VHSKANCFEIWLVRSHLDCESSIAWLAKFVMSHRHDAYTCILLNLFELLCRRGECTYMYMSVYVFACSVIGGECIHAYECLIFVFHHIYFCFL
jgi:hypothetical protein